ncbi:MAG: hypothetical protein CME06_14345 [Gemmatimonadetes bacterium]|nr:hypothetical protein [Gemmatimonadota bacterium]
MKPPFSLLREGYDQLKGVTVELNAAAEDGTDTGTLQSLIDDRGRLITILEELLAEASGWMASASSEDLTHESGEIAASVVLVHEIQEQDRLILSSFENVRRELRNEEAKVQKGRRILQSYRPGRTSDGFAVIDRKG